METAREYSEMVINKYKKSIITPLLCSWGFISTSRQVKDMDWSQLRRMSIKYKWNLNIDLKEILKDTSNVIVITDKNQEIRFASSGFERMTGYAKMEVIGKKPNFLQGKDTDRETSQRIGNEIKNGNPVSAVVLNYKKDNSPYHCKLDILPIFNKNKNLVHFIAIEKAVSL